MNDKRGQGLITVWLIFIALAMGFVLGILIAKGVIPINFLRNWMCS